MAEQHSILVLDDDPDVRELLTDYFASQGYRVTAVCDGQALREAFDTCVPDVALLDVGLPGEDGLSLARHVREHFDVGIIIVSGAGDTLDRIIGLEIAPMIMSPTLRPSRIARARQKRVEALSA
ncbi:MAG: response regulator [Thiogranum sp.]|nr:response regulator [Thiogranum sp.]